MRLNRNILAYLYGVLRARSGRRLAPLLILLSSLAFVSCKTTQPAQTGKRYELKGTVVSVDKAHSSATIDHEEIKDFMDAMTMDYTLKETWPLDVMKPGDQIQATLVVADGSSWLEDVVIAQKIGPQGTPQANSSSLPKVGDAIPDFRLINQDGKPIQLSQYRGRALLLTFIYTRCPLPQYCTLMTNNFAVLDGELRKDAKLFKQSHLLSVSFDSKYDSPKVLRSYGAAHTGEYDKETFAHWEFVTGDEKEVKRMAEFFGFTYVPDKDQFVHSLQTALIAPDGKLVKLYTGNEWKPSDVLSDIRTTIEGPR